MLNILLYTASAAAIAFQLIGTLGPARAAEDAPDAIWQRTAEIQNKYAPKFAQLQGDGEAIGNDRPSDFGAVVGVDVKVGTHRENIILKIPEFKMGLQRIVLTVPEVWTGQQRLVFGTPSVRMKRVQVGVHPEWHGLWRMEMKANYMDVPEPFMQEQVVILDLPQVKMDNQEILLHLPEVTMRERRLSFDVPDFTVKDVHVEMDKMKKRGADLQTQGNELATAMQSEISQVLVEELPKKRAEVVAQFDQGEVQILAAIDEAHKNNVDTSKPFPDGKPGLDAILNAFKDSRRTALADIDDQITKAKLALT